MKDSNNSIAILLFKSWFVEGKIRKQNKNNVVSFSCKFIQANKDHRELTRCWSMSFSELNPVPFMFQQLHLACQIKEHNSKYYTISLNLLLNVIISLIWRLFFFYGPFLEILILNYSRLKKNSHNTLFLEHTRPMNGRDIEERILNVGTRSMYGWILKKRILNVRSGQ